MLTNLKQIMSKATKIIRKNKKAEKRSKIFVCHFGCFVFSKYWQSIWDICMLNYRQKNQSRIPGVSTERFICKTSSLSMDSLSLLNFQFIKFSNDIMLKRVLGAGLHAKIIFLSLIN